MIDLKRIDKVVDEKFNDYKEIALKIHQKPEVSNYEFFASEILADKLREEGFEVKMDVAGHRTGFTASYKGRKSGKVAVFLAEYDALPEVGHACGHNIFGATSALGAVALKSLVDEIGVEVRVYGTPGEEGGENGSAKGSFVREGFFKDVDIALAVHPGFEHILTSKTLANDPVDIEFFGKASHSSSAPQNGVNALDAIIQVFNASNALRQHLTDDVRIHGIITNGGQAANVVPEYASARFYLRANSRPKLNELYKKFEKIVQGAALQTGASYKFGLFQNSVDNLVPTEKFDEVYLKYLKEYKEDVVTGKNNGVGSTDIGNVSQVIPVIQPKISISDEFIAGHSVEFREAAKSEKGLKSIALGAKVLAKTAVDILSNDELLQEIKEQHRQNLKNQ